VDQDSFLQSVTAAAAETGKPVAVLLTTPGSAVVSSFDAGAAALLNMFLGGEQLGSAYADVLFGDTPPSGKLPVTFPLAAADATAPCESNPCEYGEGLEVAWRGLGGKDVGYPFGHGLGYTQFGYAWGEEPAVAEGGGLRFSVSVSNAGERAGREVPQVYLAFPQGAGEPEMQLKAFAKTGALQAGEAQLLEFEVGAVELAVWDEEAAGWSAVEGEFEVRVGSSSRDIRLSAPVQV
jgi:beta-glucosidase